MRVKKKKLFLLLLLFFLFCVQAVPASASEDVDSPPTVDPGKTGTVTISYADDTDGKKPVHGAVFTLYKIGVLKQVLTEGTEEGSGGASVSSRFISIIPRLTVSENMDASEIQSFVEEAYREPVENGKTYTLATDGNGTASAENVEQGLYLAVETSPAENHYASVPFLISVPQMSYESGGKGTGWDYDIKAYPKSIPAGRLVIRKQLEGSAADKNAEWHFTVTFAAENLSENKTVSTQSTAEKTEGSARIPYVYPYTTSDGRSGQVTSGESIVLKDGQTAAVSMIPAGMFYRVEEKEADQDGYTTASRNEEGIITQESVQEAVFINKKESKVKSIAATNPPISSITETQGKPPLTYTKNAGNVKTGDFMEPALLLIPAAAAGGVLILHLIKNKQRGGKLS